MSWAEIAIGDLGRIVTGDTPPRKNPEYYGSAYPFIKPTDMTVGQRLTMTYEEGYSEDGFAKYRKKLIPAGSTAVVTIGSVGQKLTWLHADSFVNQAVNAVVPDRAKFDSLYVYYLLKHNLNLVKQADTGASSGRENVSKSNFSALTVWACLDLNTQKQIAEVLDALDSSIETNQRRIALLEDAARRLYREWFVHLRFPGHESVPTEGGLPEGWERGSLDRALFLQRGFDLPNGNRIAGDVPVYASTGINGFHNEAKAVGPGVVTGRSGTLGQVHYVAKDFWPLNTSLWVKEFRRVSPIVAYFLLSELNLEQFNSGASVPTLDRKTVHQASVLLPSPDLVEKFDTLVQPLFDQIDALKAGIDSTSKARDLLLPKLMSGQLDVSGIRLPDEVTV